MDLTAIPCVATLIEKNIRVFKGWPHCCLKGIICCSACSEVKPAPYGAENVPEYLLRTNPLRGDAKHPPIPEKFRGVFYMDGNSMPEELFTLQAVAYWDPEKRVLSTTPFLSRAWTFDGPPPNKKGDTTWRGLHQMTCMALMDPGVNFYFTDDTLTKATLTLTLNPPVCGCCCPCLVPLELPQDEASGLWTLEQLDEAGTVYARVSGPDRYTLRKVMGENGEKIAPNFEIMCRQVPEQLYAFDPLALSVAHDTTTVANARQDGTLVTGFDAAGNVVTPPVPVPAGSVEGKLAEAGSPEP